MSDSEKPSTYLTDRFQKAMAYATELHKDQSRKSTAITYICHPFGVASLVLEAGGEPKSMWINIPAGFTKLLNDPAYNWRFETQPEKNKFTATRFNFFEQRRKHKR